MLTQTIAVIGIASFVTLLITAFCFAFWFYKKIHNYYNADKPVMINFFLTGTVFGVMTIGLLAIFLVSIMTSHMWLILSAILAGGLTTCFAIKCHIAFENSRKDQEIKYGWLIASSVVSLALCIVFLCIGY